ASRTGAVRRVEAEDPRLELDQAGTVHRTRELLAVELNLTAVDELYLHQSTRQRHGRLDRIGEALAQILLHDQAVHHDRDVVLELLVQHDLLIQAPQLTVDLRPGEALRSQLLELLAVLTLAATNDRRHHHEAGRVSKLHHLIDDLLSRLAGDRP